MKLTNENALIASLMGSKVVEQIPRFAAVQNEISKHVLPPVRFLPILDKPSNIGYPDYSYPDYSLENELWQNDKPINVEDQFFSFGFYLEDEKTLWSLPWEPMINIQVPNRIIKRNIAKAGKNLIGSIKERWSTDDYEITITGAFYGDKMMGKSAQTYPRVDMENLRKLLLSPRSIKIESEPLQILGINRIVIESMSFPFTKGENVQAYEIKAVSDFPYELIYTRPKKKGILTVGEADGNFDR